jgi:hypothetical protein
VRRTEFIPKHRTSSFRQPTSTRDRRKGSGSTSSRFSTPTNACSSLLPLAHRLAGGSGAFSFRSFPSGCWRSGFEVLLPTNHIAKGESYSAERPGAGEPAVPVSARASENAAATPRPIYMLPVTQRWPVMNRGLAARIHRLAEPAAIA